MVCSLTLPCWSTLLWIQETSRDQPNWSLPACFFLLFFFFFLTFVGCLFLYMIACRISGVGFDSLKEARCFIIIAISIDSFLGVLRYLSGKEYFLFPFLL